MGAFITYARRIRLQDRTIMGGMFPRRSRLALPALMLWTAALGAQSLTVSTLELEFRAELGQPSPAPQTFTVETTPAGQSFTARVNRSLLVNPAWLFDPFPTNGQTPATLTVTVDTSGFDRPQTGTADIIVTSGAEQKVVKVTIIIEQASQAPSINAAPSSLSFNVQSPGLSAPPQDIIISNGGGGFLSYQIGITYPAGQHQGWLQIAPASGQVSFGSNVHEVQIVNTASLPQANYTAFVRISGIGSNSSVPAVTIPVSLSVGAAPALTANPASLSFFASEGGAFPAIQTVTVRNSGGSDIAYSIAGDQDWLFVRPATGNTASGPVAHEVVPDIRGLSQGVYLGNLRVTGAALPAPFLIPVRLTIGPPSSLFVLPSRLDFIGNSGIPIRERRSISVVNTPLGPGPWTATVVPDTATWLKVSPSTGQVPARIQVEVDTAGLGRSMLEAEIEIRSGSGEEQGVQQEGNAIRVPVRATILANSPQLDAAPRALLFHTTEGREAVLQQALLVENLGGPQLLWQSEVEVESGDWLSISPTAGEAPARTRVSASTSGLGPGVYHGRVRLVAGSQSVTVPVALAVGAAGAELDTDVSGLYWEMTEGGAPPASREVTVLNRGAGTMSWVAEAVEFSGNQQWFGIGPTSGASRADGLAGPSAFTVSPIGAGLAAGVYSGLIEVRSAGQNPRLISATLRVVPTADTVQRRVEPGGVVFVSGAALAPKTVAVHRNRRGAAPFVAGVSTVSGGDWLTATPTSGSASEEGVVTLELTADATGLTPGIYTGQAGVTFGDGIVESIAATLIVPPGGSSPCTAASFVIAPISPAEGFRALTGSAVRLEAEIRDNCGQPVDQASVLASFNSGDASTPLERMGPGRYAGAWNPANADSQANVVFTALAGALTGRRFVAGAVEGAAQAAISRLGVVNAGSFASGEAISPGAIVSVFGRNFQPETISADAVPLPTELGDLSLRLGGREAPLYFKNNTQINAQAPFELLPNSTAQAVVKVDGHYSIPEEVAVASSRPGVFALPTQPNRAIVQFPNGALSGPEVPVRPGDTVTVYLSGIGEVDPAVATNAAPPAQEPFARAVANVDATVGGEGAAVIFLGLTPGFVGLAQANIVIPPTAPVGPDIPFVLSVGDQPSATLLISVGAALP